MSLVPGGLSLPIYKMGRIKSPSQGWRDDYIKYRNAQASTWPFSPRAGPPQVSLPFPSLYPLSGSPNPQSFGKSIAPHLMLQEGNDGMLRSHIFHFAETECPSGVWGQRNSREWGFCAETTSAPHIVGKTASGRSENPPTHTVEGT